jgi:putative DNA primase/helicase
MPAWIGPVPDGLDRHKSYIAVENGIIGPVGGALHQIRLHFPTPHWFSRVKLPVTYEPFATAPRWEQFLDEVLEGDTELIHLLQEWFGYVCVADTSMQQFLILEGDGRNGKSVLLDVLMAMLGHDNVSRVPLESFGTRFQLTHTLGKLANIVAEIGELHRTDEGHLKAFVSGDAMYFDRKGIPGVDAIPTARLVFATNNRPRFGDRSDGIWRRVVVIPFRYQVPRG